MGGGGGGVMEVGKEGGRLYTYRYCVTTRMIPISRWACSDETHFNVSVIVCVCVCVCVCVFVCVCEAPGRCSRL